MQLPPPRIFHAKSYKHGFTLIELSIVLVIIGLIVGGVLVGRDLISAAEVRAQISQIEKYQTSVNTFRVKYGAIPGDILVSDAQRFGLTTNGVGPYSGDGNDVLNSNTLIPSGTVGELNLFWVNLSEIRLTEGSFSLLESSGFDVSDSQIDSYVPKAKLGGNYYITVWSGGTNTCPGSSFCARNDGKNYFGLSKISNLRFNASGPSTSTSAVRVSTAYAIDTKMDDGFPQSGSVMAVLNVIDTGAFNVFGVWAGADYYGSGVSESDGTPTNTPWSASTSSCYDNDNVSGPMHYSLNYNNGTNSTCALSFRFQ